MTVHAERRPGQGVLKLWRGQWHLPKLWRRRWHQNHSTGSRVDRISNPQDA
jgi:hypothetical protein